jgi:hypothetical protein
VELAVTAQKGFINGVLGKGRLHPVQGMLFHRMGGPQMNRWLTRSRTCSQVVSG